MKSALLFVTTFATTFAHGPEAGRRLDKPQAWSGFTGGEELGETGGTFDHCAFKTPIGIFPDANLIFESVHWQSHDNCAVGNATCAATPNAPAKGGAESTSEILNDLTIFGYEKQRMKVNFAANLLDLDNYRYYFLEHESADTDLGADADVRHEPISTVIGGGMNQWTEICPGVTCATLCSDVTQADSQQETTDRNENSGLVSEGGLKVRYLISPKAKKS